MLGFVPSARSTAAGASSTCADPEDEEAGCNEADRVDEYRIGRREDLDQDAREARSADLRCAARDLELRVALDDLIPLDERRQVRLVGDVEEDGADAHEEADDVELPERERVEDVRDRDRAEEHRAADVPGDEDSLPTHAVDPHACREREDDEREELDGRQRRDFERGWRRARGSP